MGAKCAQTQYKTVVQWPCVTDTGATILEHEAATQVLCCIGWWQVAGQKLRHLMPLLYVFPWHPLSLFTFQ